MNTKSVEICSRCAYHPETCNGPCACSRSGLDVLHHLARNQCPLGLFPEADAPAPAPATSYKLVTGAVGVAKALAGVDRPPAEVIAARRAACRQCPHSVALFGVLKRCELCGCGLAAKTAVGKERCPAGKWQSVPGSQTKGAGGDAEPPAPERT